MESHRARVKEKKGSEFMHERSGIGISVICLLLICQINPMCRWPGTPEALTSSASCMPLFFLVPHIPPNKAASTEASDFLSEFAFTWEPVNTSELHYRSSVVVIPRAQPFGSRTRGPPFPASPPIFHRVHRQIEGLGHRFAHRLAVRRSVNAEAGCRRSYVPGSRRMTLYGVGRVDVPFAFSRTLQNQ